MNALSKLTAIAPFQLTKFYGFPRADAKSRVSTTPPTPQTRSRRLCVRL
ncbi:MAG: hypothetical protein HC895_17105 [Leptolyngbyaceae cyanobacterium SM1_3_5]|nr:hypothetical protein [Leptolyngbyaceae cyanobacterium SM1_3_5]